MSKKFELLRRNENEAIDSCGRNPMTLRAIPASEDVQPTAIVTPKTTPPAIVSNNSFKTFFYRIGSTGMLNRTQTTKTPIDTRTLYRSSSTSQLNTSSYVKGDDPTDGINLGNGPKNVHISTEDVNASATESQPIKASSYDDIALMANANTDIHLPQQMMAPVKRANFPYAFLRSRLSVLPEENGGSVINHKRMQPATPLSSKETKKKSPKSEKYADGNSSTICDWKQTIMRSNKRSFKKSAGKSNGSNHDDNDTTQLDDAYMPHANESIYPPAALESATTTTVHPIRRRRIRRIPLKRKTAYDCVGITLTQQFYNANEPNIVCRYVVSEIRGNGLAYSDGRLRIGDEIVNVNGHDLRALQYFDDIQQLIESFVDNTVELVIAHDEITTFNGDAVTQSSIIDAGNQNRNDYDRLSANESSLDNCPICPDVMMVHPPSMKFVTTADEQSNDRCVAHKMRNNEMLPLQSESHYVPVYGDRTSITNTISDDEKWQILSRKRSEFLSKFGYAENRYNTDDEHKITNKGADAREQFSVKTTGDVRKIVQALDRMSASTNEKIPLANNMFTGECAATRADRTVWRKPLKNANNDSSMHMHVPTTKRTVDGSISVKPIWNECSVNGGHAISELCAFLTFVVHSIQSNDCLFLSLSRKMRNETFI